MRRLRIKILKEGYSVGDVVKLNRDCFKRKAGKTLNRMNHMYLIVNADEDQYVVCPLSSNESKVNSKFPYNVGIDNWRRASLKKPTHAITDTYGNVSEEDIYDFVGHINNRDLRNILAVYDISPQRTRLEQLNNY